MADLARAALEAYPLSGLRVRLQAHLFNTTFRVVAPGGDQYLLRIPRAVPLTALQRRPDHRALREALLMGYRLRRPLSAEQEGLLDTFMALRRIQDLDPGGIEGKDPRALRAAWQANRAGGLRELLAFVDP